MFSLSTFLHFEIRSFSTPYPVSPASQAGSVVSRQSARGHWSTGWHEQDHYFYPLSSSPRSSPHPCLTPSSWPNFQVGITFCLSLLSLSDPVDDFDLSKTENLSGGLPGGLGPVPAPRKEEVVEAKNGVMFNPGQGWAGLEDWNFNQKSWWNKILSLNLISWFETK